MGISLQPRATILVQGALGCIPAPFPAQLCCQARWGGDGEVLDRGWHEDGMGMPWDKAEHQQLQEQDPQPTTPPPRCSLG